MGAAVADVYAKLARPESLCCEIHCAIELAGGGEQDESRASEATKSRSRGLDIDKGHFN